MSIHKRRFDTQLKFRVTKEMENIIKGEAEKHGLSLADYLRQALSDYIKLENAKAAEGYLDQIVSRAIEKNMRPFEERLAKIIAKTAYATAISTYLEAKLLADLGCNDMVELFHIARQKGIAFVREGIPNTHDLKKWIQEITGGD